MKHAKLIVLLLPILAYFGCDSTAPVTDHSIQDIVPLDSGNRWTYLVTQYTGGGGIQRIDTIGNVIGAPLTFNGNSGYYPSDCACKYGFLHYSGNDLVAYDSSDKTSSIVLRYPMGSDESIIVVDSIDQQGLRLQGTLRMLSTNASVTVPAGTFSCVKYEDLYLYGADTFLDTAQIIYRYYAPGVGLVMQEQYRYSPNDTPPQIEFSSKLLSYSLHH
jgi:uncharacterized protein DUF3108